MPEFIRPKRAIIETGGDGGLLALLAFIAAVCLLVAVVAAWVLAHAVLIAIVLAVFVVALGAFCAWSRRMASPRRLAEHFATQRAAVASAPAQPDAPLAVRTAILAPPRAIAQAQHLHVHFHGVSAEDAAAIIRRQETPGRPAIEEEDHPWSPPSSS